MTPGLEVVLPIFAWTQKPEPLASKGAGRPGDEKRIDGRFCGPPPIASCPEAITPFLLRVRPSSAWTCWSVVSFLKLLTRRSFLYTDPFLELSSQAFVWGSQAVVTPPSRCELHGVVSENDTPRLGRRSKRARE